MIKANFPSTPPSSSSQSGIGVGAKNISSQKLEENFLLFSEHLTKPGIANNMLLGLIFKNLSNFQKNLLLAQSQNLISEETDSLAKQADFAMVPGEMIVDEKNGDVGLLEAHEQFLGNLKPFLSDDLSEQSQTLHQQQSSGEDTKPHHSLSAKNLPEHTQDLGSAPLHSHSQHIPADANKEVLSHFDPKGYYAEHPGVPLQQSSGQKSTPGGSDSLKEPVENLEKTSTSYFFKIATRCFVGVVVAIVSILVFAAF